MVGGDAVWGCVSCLLSGLGLVVMVVVGGWLNHKREGAGKGMMGRGIVAGWRGIW